MISYLLTSDKTEERFDWVLNHLKEFGYDPIIFWGPEIESERESNSIGHVQILKNFLDTDSENCLVFEDDCLLEKKIPLDLLENLEFDIFLIGGRVSDIKSEFENYKISEKFLQTHCYVISRKGAEKFLKEVKSVNEIGYIDHFMAKIFPQIHSLNPLIAKQNLKFRSKIPKK